MPIIQRRLPLESLFVLETFKVQLLRLPRGSQLNGKFSPIPTMLILLMGSTSHPAWNTGEGSYTSRMGHRIYTHVSTPVVQPIKEPWCYGFTPQAYEQMLTVSSCAWPVVGVTADALQPSSVRESR
jgi:hypothetical protein